MAVDMFLKLAGVHAESEEGTHREKSMFRRRAEPPRQATTRSLKEPERGVATGKQRSGLLPSPVGG